MTSRRITITRRRTRRHDWRREESRTYFIKYTEKDYRTWWICAKCDAREATWDGEEPRGKYLPKCKLSY